MLGEQNQTRMTKRTKKLSMVIPEVTYNDNNNNKNNNDNNRTRLMKFSLPDINLTSSPRSQAFTTNRPLTIAENLSPSTAPTKTRRYSSVRNPTAESMTRRKLSSAKPPGGRVRRKTMAATGNRIRKNTLALPSLKNLLAQKPVPGSNIRVPSISFVVARIKSSSVPERNYLYDHYEGSGDFERDFTFLAHLIGLDLSVTGRRKIPTMPLTPRSAFRESSEDNSSYEGQISARSWPSLAKRVLSREPSPMSSRRSCSPTFYVVTKDDIAYFKPRIEITTELEEMTEKNTQTEKEAVVAIKNPVTGIYARGCKLDLSLINVLSKTLPDLGKLTTLNLWNAGLKDDSLHCLSQCLQLTPSLTTLCLDGNDQVEGQRFHAFVQPRSQLNLKNLSLRHCNINQAGTAYLAEALEENTYLLTLNLSYNKSGNEGARLLSNAMRTNRTLLSLNLSHNRIGDEGAKCFADVISTFPLTHLETVARRVEESKQKREVDDLVAPLRRATIGKLPKITVQKKKTRSGSRTPSRPRSSIEKTKRSMTSSSLGGPVVDVVDETKKTTNPLMRDEVRFLDGQLWITGNRCLINLNLSRNELTEKGLQSLHSAVKHQSSEVVKTFGPGLLKLSLHGNRFPKDDPVYVEVGQILEQRQAFL